MRQNPTVPERWRGQWQVRHPKMYRACWTHLVYLNIYLPLPVVLNHPVTNFFGSSFALPCRCS